MPPPSWPGTGSRRWSWPRRRAWRSPTARTGCWECYALAVHDTAHLLTVADIVAGLSVEGLLATDRAYAADLQALRPHPGQAASAANLRAVLAGVTDRRQPPDRLPAGPGRLFDPVHSPGAWRGARHPGLRQGGDRA